MYSEACEAQGMTLADLIKKQDEDNIRTYSWTAWDKGDTDVTFVHDGELYNLDGVWVEHLYSIYVVNDTGLDRAVYWRSPWTKTEVPFTDGKTPVKITWAKSYGDIEYTASMDKLVVATLVPYYSTFGLSKVELPEDCTNVKAMWDDVCTRVNEKYWKRYLSCETLEEWQVELQVLTDAIARRYERALRLYKANANAIEKEFGAKQVTEYGDLKDTSEQTKDSKTNTTVSATPDQKINDDETYAGTTSNGSSNTGTTEHTRTGKITVTQVGGDSMIGAINDNVAKWHDIETELVDEYAHVFMSYIWS